MSFYANPPRSADRFRMRFLNKLHFVHQTFAPLGHLLPRTLYDAVIPLPHQAAHAYVYHPSCPVFLQAREPSNTTTGLYAKKSVAGAAAICLTSEPSPCGTQLGATVNDFTCRGSGHRCGGVLGHLR